MSTVLGINQDQLAEQVQEVPYTLSGGMHGLEQGEQPVLAFDDSTPLRLAANVCNKFTDSDSHFFVSQLDEQLLTNMFLASQQLKTSRLPPPETERPCPSALSPGGRA